MGKRTQTLLAVIVVAAGLMLAGILGLFAYMSAIARPLHPDLQAISSVSRSAPAPKWAAAVEQGRQIARQGLTGQNLPGLSVAVGIGGDLVWAEGFGWADLGQHVPVSPDTRFRIGEVSIPLTSAGAGLLLEKKKLNLNADIQQYVPDFPPKQWPVTLRQLMGHVAGLRNDAGDEEPILERCERTVDGLRRFAGSRLLFQPGTQYRFSSYGWILVSAAMESAAGEPFFTFMRANVFRPLAMNDTIPDFVADEIPNRATFYFPRFAANNHYGPDVARPGDHSCFAGAGAYLSTPSDLVRFGMAINAGKLLQPATLEFLQTPQRLASGQETGYGLGWTLETVSLAGKPTLMPGHGTKPDFMGGTASLTTFPERGIVVAVTSNVSFADTKSVAISIADVFAKEERR
jgi:serine beta-lactamase-like protein LACTB, mitochondrial